MPTHPRGGPPRVPRSFLTKNRETKSHSIVAWLVRISILIQKKYANTMGNETQIDNKHTNDNAF